MRYKFVADWKGIVVDYNPTYRANLETGINFMKRKIKETQEFHESFNKPVRLYIYERIDGKYKEIENFWIE